jgi:hypothetical protein
MELGEGDESSYGDEDDSDKSSEKMDKESHEDEECMINTTGVAGYMNGESAAD